ncbi:MAG TPA: hypothetical protein VGT99_06835, partial [Gammaproteobacteria bacterium]|nr:hypothetical protein [Gammaproteobacteria bacterium]
MLRIASVVIALSLCLLGSGAAGANGSGPGAAKAVAEACSTEEKWTNTEGAAISRLTAARTDLELKYGGRCRANALKLTQAAY